MIRSIAIAFILLSMLISGFFLFQKETNNRKLKEDLIVLSKAKYGLFNVDEWKVILTEIIIKKIDEFQFDDRSKEDLEKKITAFLLQAIDAVEAGVKANRFSSIKGFFQNAVSWGADLFDNMRAEAPSLAKAIVEDLEKPETRDALKKYIADLIEKYADKTFADVDYSEVDVILKEYGQLDRTQAKVELTDLLHGFKQETVVYKLVLYSCTIVLALYFLLISDVSKFQLSFGLIACFSLLLLGLSLPMIDIDARIDRFSFSILGEQVGFYDQVLYFKSKSILEVVVLMLTQAKIEVVIVGFLVFSFSVIFPLLKIISSLLVLVNSPFKNQSWVRFFAFKSGKWSMADVLVVAIFMAYIGFTSILSEQLRQLESLTESIEILTTNESTLNTGFFTFFGFVLLGLLISSRLKDVDAK